MNSLFGARNDFAENVLWVSSFCISCLKIIWRGIFLAYFVLLYKPVVNLQLQSIQFEV